MPKLETSESRRDRMIESQLARFANERVLGAFRAVPRELFAPSGFKRRLAYLPMPLGIGHGQTMSQPAIVAYMIQLAEINQDSEVLDVGAGSGYQTAVLAQLSRYVHGIEIIPALAERANESLRAAGIGNAHVHTANGFLGLPQSAPYDAIIVAAASPTVPQALLSQLKDGGRLIIPVGPHLAKSAMTVRILLKRPSPQRLVKFVRQGDSYKKQELGMVYFVPFIDSSPGHAPKA